MNNTTNLSAPSSPSGTSIKSANNKVSANNESGDAGKLQPQQQEDSDDQLPAKLARSRSLSDIERNHPADQPSDSSDLLMEAPKPPTHNLKVKIKTKIDVIKDRVTPVTPTVHTIGPCDSNNNTGNNISNVSSSSTTNTNSNNNGTISSSSSSSSSSSGGSSKPVTESPTSNIKTTPSPASTPKSTNSRTGGRKSKNNGDISSATSTSTSNNSSFSSTGSSSPAAGNAISVTKAQPVTNNSGGSSMAENGKKTMPASMPLPPLQMNQHPQIQPIPPTQQPLQTQSQQPPLPVLTQPHLSTQPPSTLSPTKPPGTAPSPSQTTPKPKTTRAKKQPTANSKNANTTNAIAPPKQEAKTRTKKAKQTVEAKAAASTAAAAAATAITTPASSQNLQPILSVPSTAAPSSAPASDKKASTCAAKKRKPRVPPPADTSAQPTNPPKRTRKKKVDPSAVTHDTNINSQPLMSSNMTLPPLSVNSQLLSVASNIPMGASPLMSNAPQPPYQTMQQINRSVPGMSPLDIQDHNQRQHSLSKLLFTSSSSSSAIPANPHSDEILKAFEELRDQSWTHLSKCILEPAQQFDIPSLIGTLYELRADNEKQMKRVKDLSLQREQLTAMNAKLDLSGPMLLQNLNQTSPGFASVMAGLQNSPKSLPNSSPSPAMNKSPIVSGGAYNHVPPGSSLGPPGIIYDRSSPMVGLQTQHSGVNSLKSSMISTPSPPTSAFMAHGANNRAGLMTVNNSPYISNVHPSMSALNSLGGQAPPSYYSRQ